MSDFDSEGGVKSDKQPMYSKDPDDDLPIGRKTFFCSVFALGAISFGLLVVLIMSLNGTIPPVNDANYVRPANVSDMNEYDVVKQSMVQCRQDLPMDIRMVKFNKDPLILPGMDFDYDFDMTVRSNLTEAMAEEMGIELNVQFLSPPWRQLPCHNNQGSCRYNKQCDNIGQLFGKKNCTQLTLGTHQGKVTGQMIQTPGLLGWTANPGNYMVQAKILYRDEVVGCVFISLRVRNKP